MQKWRRKLHFGSKNGGCRAISAAASRQYFSSAHAAPAIDLLAPEVLRAYQARPERLRERIDAEPGATTVVVDEVQKAPQLLDVVHSLVEERPELRFVLTGSSARKLRHGAANLLGGRLVAAHMPPFMAAELGDGFTWSGHCRSA